MKFRNFFGTILRWLFTDITYLYEKKDKKNIKAILKYFRSCDGEIAYSDIACPDSDIFQYSSFSSYSNMFLRDG